MSDFITESTASTGREASDHQRLVMTADNTKTIINFIDFCIEENPHIKSMLEVSFMHYIKKHEAS